MSETKLMKGNEALAEAAIRAGADGYFGYPITPQSEILEYLMMEKPWERTGMVVLQAESEVAAVNMVYGGAGCGKRVLTSSSGPGVSLMQEGISYLVGSELPCLLVNVGRGGPGLGTIQPSQADYFQTVKGGGHGDYKILTLAPASVQEMSDFVSLGFELAFKYRNPVMILTDGVIGQMMEKVILKEQEARLTEADIIAKYGDWATTGKPTTRPRNVINSLELESSRQEKHVIKLFDKYKIIEDTELRYELTGDKEPEYLIVAYGASARISSKAMEMAEADGIKCALLRLITLWPFPYSLLKEKANNLKAVYVVEMSMGQMVEDVRLAVAERCPIYFYGRSGGSVPMPKEVYENLKKMITY